MADEAEFSAELQADAPAVADVAETPAVEVAAIEVEAEVPAVVAEVAAAPAKPGRKPRAKAAPAAADVVEPVAAKVAPVRKPRAAKAAAPAKSKTKAAPARRRASAAKSVSPVSAAKPAPQAAAKPVASRRASTKRTTQTPSTLGTGKPKLAQFKEFTMATPFDFSKFQTAFADIQGKAKAALEKSTAALGDANEFAKGNVEALVESGKVLTAGLQDFGATAVAETRGAFDTLTADAKELAAAKSPTEFFQLQSAIVRKQFDGAVAQASKNTEAFLKLANDTFAPLSSRVTLAVEKVSKVA